MITNFLFLKSCSSVSRQQENMEDKSYISWALFVPANFVVLCAFGLRIYKLQKNLENLKQENENLKKQTRGKVIDQSKQSRVIKRSDSKNQDTAALLSQSNEQTHNDTKSQDQSLDAKSFTRIQELERQLESTWQAKLTVEKQSQILKKDLEQSQQTRDTFEREVLRITQEIEKYKALELTWNTQVQELAKKSESIESEKHVLIIQLHNVNLQLQEVKNEKEGLLQQINSQQASETKRISDLQQQLDSYKSDQSSLKLENQQFKDTIKNLKDTIQGKQSELDQWKKDSVLKSDELRKKLETSENLRLKELQHSTEEVAVLKSQLESLSLKLKEMEAKNSELLQIQTQNELTITELKQKHKQIEEFPLSATRQNDTNIQSELEEEQTPLSTKNVENTSSPEYNALMQSLTEGSPSHSQSQEIPTEHNEDLASLLSQLDAQSTEEFTTVTPRRKKKSRAKVQQLNELSFDEELNKPSSETETQNQQAISQLLDISAPEELGSPFKIPQDETEDLLALLDSKSAKNLGRSKTVGRINIATNSSDNNNATEDSRHVNRLKDLFQQPKQIAINEHPKWTKGNPIIRDLGLKEDINRKGIRKTKKKTKMFGTGNPKLEMEDQNLIVWPWTSDQDKCLVAVFDGHAGKECAVDAVNYFQKEFGTLVDSLQPLPTNMQVPFKDAYAAVDKLLLPHEYVGCTATTVFIWQSGENRYLQCANVGDSTSFLKRGNSVVKLSKDHKPTDPDERIRIVTSGIELGENQTRVGGLAVSRALGDHFLKQMNQGVIGEPYICQPIQLTEEDTILIVASDGLWDVMTGEQAVEVCESITVGSAELMATTLIRTALDDPKCTDNITVIVVLL